MQNGSVSPPAKTHKCGKADTDGVAEVESAPRRYERTSDAPCFRCARASLLLSEERQPSSPASRSANTRRIGGERLTGIRRNCANRIALIHSFSNLTIAARQSNLDWSVY